MLWKDYEIDWLRSQNLTEIVVFFDQSKNNRNHEKLKVDFHCRVILRTSFTAWIQLAFRVWWLASAETKSWTTFNFFCRRKPSVHFFYLFSILFRFGRDFYVYWDRWNARLTNFRKASASPSGTTKCRVWILSLKWKCKTFSINRTRMIK